MSNLTETLYVYYKHICFYTVKKSHFCEFNLKFSLNFLFKFYRHCAFEVSIIFSSKVLRGCLCILMHHWCQHFVNIAVHFTRAKSNLILNFSFEGIPKYTLEKEKSWCSNVYWLYSRFFQCNFPQNQDMLYIPTEFSRDPWSLKFFKSYLIFFYLKTVRML